MTLLKLPLSEIWKQRSLVVHFAWMNIKIRHKTTYLGLLWTALEPALLFLFLYVLFTSLRFGTEEDFGIYLLTGLVLYHAFTRGTQSGLGSLRENYNIMTSLNIKREFFPVVSTTTAAILMLVEIGVLFIIMGLFQFSPTWTIVLLPAVFALMLILILGLSYFLSVVYVHIRDIQPVWNIFVHALFFMSPIFWYVKDVGGIVLTIHSINPVGQIIELGHKIVVFGEIPPLNDWLYAIFLVLFVFVVGYTLFRKLERRALEAL